MKHSYYIYILASKKDGVLYIGVTNNLLRRVYEHKKKFIIGFTSKYSVSKLVYFEETDSIQAAIQREKQIKKWYRKWKIELIKEFNPEWKDLYYEFGGEDEYPEIDVHYSKKKDSRLTQWVPRGNDI